MRDPNTGALSGVGHDLIEQAASRLGLINLFYVADGARQAVADFPQQYIIADPSGEHASCKLVCKFDIGGGNLPCCSTYQQPDLPSDRDLYSTCFLLFGCMFANPHFGGLS